MPPRETTISYRQLESSIASPVAGLRIGSQLEVLWGYHVLSDLDSKMVLELMCCGRQCSQPQTVLSKPKLISLNLWPLERKSSSRSSRRRTSGLKYPSQLDCWADRRTSRPTSRKERSWLRRSPSRLWGRPSPPPSRRREGAAARSPPAKATSRGCDSGQGDGERRWKWKCKPQHKVGLASEGLRARLSSFRHLPFSLGGRLAVEGRGA